MIFLYKNGYFDLDKKTYVVGILNLTPDSFSDGGKYKTIDDVLFAVQKMQQDGVDLIDVGGESTRPGFSPVSVDEELCRVIPVIKKIHERFSIPISIDTTKSAVAKEAIGSGVSIINDIWGCVKDPKMLNVIKDSGVGVIIGHNRNSANISKNIFLELEEFFEKIINKAQEMKIPKEYLCIDPNIGFAKTYEENIEIIKNLSYFLKFKLPILIGVSRKSVIGQTLGLPVDQRLEGSLALAVICALGGANFVRVHDVKETVRALKMADKIFRN
ncbi:MAG: dihydropteroate synthase [Oscillospiraceae bacterium]|nr:dihydropteroate synthase [Oscillospiraceae bacterium]